MANETIASHEHIDAFVGLLEELVEAVIYSKQSNSVEAAMDVVRKRSELIVYLINRERAIERKYRLSYDVR